MTRDGTATGCRTLLPAQDSRAVPAVRIQVPRDAVMCSRARPSLALLYGGAMTPDQPRATDGKWMSPGSRPAPVAPPPTRRATKRCSVSLRPRAVRRRAERAGVPYDKCDPLGTMAAVARAEASERCDRLEAALARAEQIPGRPVEVARQLVRDGYTPDTAAAASVFALGV